MAEVIRVRSRKRVRKKLIGESKKEKPEPVVQSEEKWEGSDAYCKYLYWLKEKMEPRFGHRSWMDHSALLIERGKSLIISEPKRVRRRSKEVT